MNMLRPWCIVLALTMSFPLAAQESSPDTLPSAALTPVVLTIDLHRRSGPFLGWGTSLAWWAHGIGSWPESKVDEIVRLVTDPDNGMGMNVFRYNIGGGDHPDHHHLRRWGDVPGFKPVADALYDWSADAAQRNVLLKLVEATKAHGVKPIVEAFSNSPPWWMTISGCASGAVDGGPNLKPGFERVFAGYLADVVRFYRDEHGLVFDTLEPFNEPDATWWKAGHNQEGIHFARADQPAMIRATRAALDERGLHATKVSATDANSIDDALASLESFNAETLAALGQVNAHSYGGSKRAELRDAAARAGKPLSQSESGPLNMRGPETELALRMAQRIVADMNRLQPRIWCTWQIIDTRAWGALHEAPEQPETVTLAKMFYVLSTFTQHIRPGDRFIPLDSDDALAAVSESRGEIVFLLVNLEKFPRPFKLALQNAGDLPASATALCTSTTQDLVALDPVVIRNRVIETDVPAESVVRLVIDRAE